MNGLKVDKLKVEVGGVEILHGVSIDVRKGEIHALMGPNGSGKSTLALSLMGHPNYVLKSGKIIFDGAEINSDSAEERSRKGLFLAFQYPREIPGVSLFNLLRTSYNSCFPKKELTISEFRELVNKKLAEIGMDQEFLSRSVNEGFSGGEKKRSEILQMAVLSPTIAILDETDSGLDVDALKTVARGVKKLVGKDLGVLVITHYQRLLHFLKPDVVHVMIGGKIVRTDGFKLVSEIEEKGYSFLRKEV